MIFRENGFCYKNEDSYDNCGEIYRPGIVNGEFRFESPDSCTKFTAQDLAAITDKLLELNRE